MQEWGIEPRGDGASYLQAVKVEGIKATSRSTLTVQVGSEVRTFKDGEGITFPKFVGAKRTFTADRVEFAAYGLDAPGEHYSDLAGHDFRGAAVVFLGAAPPAAVDASIGRRLLYGRAPLADRADAGGRRDRAGVSEPPGARRPDDDRGASRGPDFTTTERLDRPEPPALTANDAVPQFLFSRRRPGMTN